MEENINKQKDEIEALSSIYGTDFHIENATTNSLSIEINEHENALLEISLPTEYPSSAPPIYSLSAPWLKGFQRKQLCSCLEDIYLENIGESVIYLWVEKIRQFILEEVSETENNATNVNDNKIAKIPKVFFDINQRTNLVKKICQKVNFGVKFLPSLAAAKGLSFASMKMKLSLESSVSSLSLKSSSKEEEEEEEECPEIISGEIITDRKSSFQPHIAEVHSLSEVKRVLKNLYENKKIANATHNMYAYRFCAADSNAIFQDCEDDGETHAGGRMLHLLQILDSQNVLVVVSRWYGGIQLGPDRFKHINNAARQILGSCGYIKEKESKKKSKKK